MKNFTRTSVKTLNEDIQIALAKVGKKHGVKFNYKGGRFTNEVYTPKFEVGIVSETGVIHTKERADFRKVCAMHGISPTILDCYFVAKGSRMRYQLIGAKSKATKFPFIAKDNRGRSFKFTADVIRTAKFEQMSPLEIMTRRMEVQD